MKPPYSGKWSVVLVILLLAFTFGCSGGGTNIPLLPDDGAMPAGNTTQVATPDLTNYSGNHGLWGSGYLVVNEEDMSIEVLPSRTGDAHYDVTWVKNICPTCVTAYVKGFNPDTRIFNIELHTKNPTNKIGRDVRFIVNLDGTGEYDMVNPDDYTKFWSMTGVPNPFRALAQNQSMRMYLPAANHVEWFNLYISPDHTPVTYIPYKIDVSFPNNALEGYTITDIVTDGELPPGGGGSMDVDLVLWDWQDNHGEVWLRTGGVFTIADILMTPGAIVGTHGRAFSTTFSNDLGSAAGMVDILVEAYSNNTVVEPMPLNDYVQVYADPGGESAIAGDVFNALTKLAVNTSVINIHNTGGGADPPPFTVTDGTYFVPVLAGTYSVQAIHNLYFAQNTIADVIVPADTTVLVCFGLAPKWLDDPTEAIATISGVIRNGQNGEPILGAQATLDGGPVVGGIIQARVTDIRGHYCFYSVPTYQQTVWTVHAYHPDYLPDDFENVPSAKNKATAQIDFDLTLLNADAVWFEDFEVGPSNVGTKHDWTWQRVATESWPGGSSSSSYHINPETGDNLWRIQDPGSEPVNCIFYGLGICTLPPDDTSAGWIPAAFQGHRYMWYGENSDTTGGQPHSGSFIDEWNGSTSAGGTSTNGHNACTAKTGPIDLTGYTELTLTMQNWWEIEAVDPSVQYDACDVLISTNGTLWYRLDRLNPLAEPIPDSGNADKAYTSAGYHQAAVWSPGVYDISSYGGNATVYLRFDFDTRDPLYNGFRGWLIDDLAIWPFSIN